MEISAFLANKTLKLKIPKLKKMALTWCRMTEMKKKAGVGMKMKKR